MKRVARLVMSLLAVFSYTAYSEVAEVPAPIKKIVMPVGFDNNDNVEITLVGKFPNLCYKVGRIGFTLDEAKHEIKVWATALMHDQNSGFCAQVLNPFVQKIAVGVLETGDYTILLEDDSSLKTKFSVSRATTNTPDEYHYAPVSTAEFKVEADEQVVVLSGHYPRLYVGCMVMEDVRMSINPKDVLVVQPIVKILENDECDRNYKHYFSVKTVVPEHFVGEGVMHVRVSNGNSIINYIESDQ
ncbi:MAG: hypothetical protein HYW48_02685 [Deltaproteobacteria bacterium]|nr:hypothetical protein [Deltaproteobacteria bacterium]